MNARTRSLIPLRYKLGAGVITFLVFVAMTGGFSGGDGRKDPDYTNRDEFRLASFQIIWTDGATNKQMHFRYSIGHNKGNDTAFLAPYTNNGYAKNGQRITMWAGVAPGASYRVANMTCQAYVDGNPVHTDQDHEPGKWINCWTVVAW